MELKIRDGDYVRRSGRLERATGQEALLERVLFKLSARRGRFPFLPKLGSRLYQLGRTSGSARQTMAEQYVVEALADEAELTVESVRLTGEGLELTLQYQGESLSLDLNLGA